MSDIRNTTRQRRRICLVQSGALLFVLVLSFILPIALSGRDIGRALHGFTRATFGSSYALAEVLVKAISLTLCGLGVAAGFHSGFVNIGAEGQFYIGAIVVTLIGTYGASLPLWLLFVLSLAGGFVAAGLWALIPGILRARFGLSEVINTIMLNYIAIYIVGLLLQTALKDPSSYFPQSPYMPEGFALPLLAGGTRLHAGLIVALVAAAALYFFINKSRPGFESRVVGLNPRAAQCAGIPVARTLIFSSLLSGGMAGLAGVCEILGLQHRLMEGISPGYGYLAVIVALLGRKHPFGVLLSALGISVLQVGSQGMQRSAGVPASVADITMACVVFVILIAPDIRRRLNRKHTELHHETDNRNTRKTAHSTSERSLI